MDEYAALAQRVVLTMDDVRGCLVLSRDGMVLGAYPEEDEQAFKPAWLKFVNVGEARRGFVEFSDQLWAYVHRGPYAAFVISGIGVRPGVLRQRLRRKARPSLVWRPSRRLRPWPRRSKRRPWSRTALPARLPVGPMRRPPRRGSRRLRSDASRSV